MIIRMYEEKEPDRRAKSRKKKSTDSLISAVNGLTDKDVNVSIDGAHIKTGNTVHFDIDGFMADNDCQKIDGNMKRWQGAYELMAIYKR